MEEEGGDSKRVRGTMEVCRRKGKGEDGVGKRG